MSSTDLILWTPRFSRRIRDILSLDLDVQLEQAWMGIVVVGLVNIIHCFA